jgi:hypothetical protein
VNNDGRGDRPNWDQPTDPGLGQLRPPYQPRQYGRPQQYGQPHQPGQPGYGGRRAGTAPPPTAYDDDVLGAPPRRNRTRMMIAIGGSVALVVMLVTVGLVLLNPGSKPGPVSATDPQTAGGPTTTADPTATPPATTTPAAPPTTTTSKKLVLPKPTVTVKPPAKEIPPAPPPPTTPAGCTGPTYSGTAASKTDVKSALLAAAHQEYWQGVQLPAALTVPLPKITVPDNLMMAFAQQESGWQSNIIACDGGIGTMQLMPGTVSQVNGRFGTNYDVNTLAGNTRLGAEYIEWLIMYFGIFHFQQHFDLSTVEKVGPNGEELTLERVVVAAYNVGPTVLEQSDGTLVLGPVATQYANNVLALEAAANWPHD